MTEIDLGKAGEILAVQHLESLDYEVVEKNFRAGKGEIDIIAWTPTKPKTLVFVEVKTRSSDFFGSPEAFVGKDKQRIVAATAGAYMQKIKYDWAIRFDIVAIMIRKSGVPEINHIEDAWFPRN
jgi:putative endonuclease